jgi:DNA repair exonuclease SbcCD ATPase subunit
LGSALRKQQTAGAELSIQHQNLTDRLLSWLADHGVGNRDEYVRKIEAHEHTVQQQAQWRTQIQQALQEQEIELEQLKRDVNRRLNHLDQQGVPAAGRTELELRRLEQQLQEKTTAVEALRTQKTQLVGRKERAHGQISGSLGEIPQTIVKIEKTIAEIEKKIEQMLLDRRAAALARDLFADLAAEGDTTLEDLRQELTRQFGEIVTQREIRLQTLNTETISVTDAEGTDRPFEMLSRGTKDAFVLAARLALARKSRPETGILVLDEPFYTLDAQRMRQALTMLKNFQTQTGWQIIILTKDQELVQQAQRLFDRAVVHTL